MNKNENENVKQKIDEKKLKKIVQGSYKCIKKKETNNLTKQSVLNEIVKLIEEVLKDGD